MTTALDRFRAGGNYTGLPVIGEYAAADMTSIITAAAARPMSKVAARKLANHHVFEMETRFNQSKILMMFYLRAERIEPPKAVNDESFIRRLLCLKWWTRKLLTRDKRDRETVKILEGRVSKGKEIYCSDDTVKQVKTQWAHTLEGMGQKLMVSDDGDEVEMLDILKSSLANPENRRAELMVRMAGFELYADQNGHIGMFYTITCPSKYHRYSGKDSKRLNKKYTGQTPRDAQRYLTKVWAKIRHDFDRWGVKPYGFRVAEPHHDGTPHWHILLFMPRDLEYLITEIIEEYATLEDSYELTSSAARGARFNAKRILKEIITKDGVKKVSATGYIAKYIAKNIGFDIGMDSEDETQTTEQTSDRVRAWASRWAIRQFQQIGGASVSVWRELRRLKDHDIEHDVIRTARDCCINNDWAGFLVAMGGHEIKRIEQEIQLIKREKVDTETGEILLNAYQELVFKIIGIATASIEMVTHFKQWHVLNKPRVSGSGWGVDGASRTPSTA